MPRPFGARNDILNFYTEAMVEGGAPRSESKYVWLPVATIPLFNQRMYDDCPESVTHWLAALPPAFEPPAPRPPPGPRRNTGGGLLRDRYAIACYFAALEISGNYHETFDISHILYLISRILYLKPEVILWILES